MFAQLMRHKCNTKFKLKRSSFFYQSRPDNRQAGSTKYIFCQQISHHEREESGKGKQQ